MSDTPLQAAIRAAFNTKANQSALDSVRDELRALEGYLLNFTTDSTVAYSKSIPANSFDYAAINSYGGRSIAWNQLVDSSTSTVTLISGRKYITVVGGTWTLVTGNGSAVSVTPGTDQVFDLTLMFGAGNEPSTVAEFQAFFPDEYYAYTEGEIKSAGVNKIVSRDSNSDVLAEMNIPAEILALPGYGWSAGSVYNEIDWENKKYIQRVGQVDLRDLEWHVDTVGGNSRFDAVISSQYKPVETTDRLTYTSDTFVPNYSPLGANSVDFAISGYSNDNHVYASDFSCATVTEFLAKHGNSKLNYRLATPIETDISELLDDNHIQVESGGTITFENALGDSYRIPVPSTVLTAQQGA
jgi:hypothetical protein